MYLTTRSVWLTALGCLVVLLVPRPVSVLAWCAGVVALVALDVLAAPSPRALRVERSLARAIRLGESTTASCVTRGRRRPEPATSEAGWRCLPASDVVIAPC